VLVTEDERNRPLPHLGMHELLIVLALVLLLDTRSVELPADHSLAALVRLGRGGATARPH
jgi:hypothetical protein